MRPLLLVLCVVLVSGAAWLGQEGVDANRWETVVPGVLRAPGPVAGYALVSGDKVLLIDAPVSKLDEARRIDEVWLTHYHREVLAGLPELARRARVRAPKGAEEWLSKKGVAKYWQESLPLRNSRTAYLVHSTGFEGIQYALAEGPAVDWEGWRIQVLDTPGPARAHVAFVAQKADGPRVAFCGAAFTSSGNLWAPYTTDWDHWTDAGLKMAAASLRKLRNAKPDVLCPTHGPVLRKDVDGALRKTIDNVEEAGFLKSFERFTKERLGHPPTYRFLARDQAESNGSKPWSRVSEHLYLTGNTYVLTSKDGVCLMVDPWGKRSVEQFAKLQAEKNVGPLEVVMFSHAHYDHYDGIYDLPGRDQFAVWALDAVAAPIADPLRLRAPFLDARPVRFERRPTEGESLTWREYRFRFHFLPGQSEFTMGVETTIDGKHCLFTADNFFHQDMYSGSGGWMGLNRSFPPLYAASARKVMEIAPQWVLAEHGGPFEYDAEDFRRRVAWGEAGARAADTLSPSGNHRRDWNPHRVHLEPVVQRAKAGDTLRATFVVDNPGGARETLSVTCDMSGQERSWQAEVAGRSLRREIELPLPAALTPGRHVFPLRITRGTELDPSDAFLAVDVE